MGIVSHNNCSFQTFKKLFSKTSCLDSNFKNDFKTIDFDEMTIFWKKIIFFVYVILSALKHLVGNQEALRLKLTGIVFSLSQFSIQVFNVMVIQL